MRSRSFAVVGVLVLFGFLGFRILDLERRVAMLSEQVGVAAAAESPAAQNAPATSSTPTPAYAKRLAAVEKRIDALASLASRRTTNTGDPGSSDLAKEQSIISVIERENSRIRDVQLEFHRKRWLETRDQQLAIFATQFHLSSEQVASLHGAIEHELDEIVGIMKRPTFAEEPDAVAGDWQAVLADTDKRAQDILSPEQLQFWQQGRAFERRTLWPWLPNQATAQK